MTALYRPVAYGTTPPRLWRLPGLFRPPTQLLPDGVWPWNDQDLICDFDNTTGQYYSGSLGSITAADALTVTRSTAALAENSAGLLEEATANTLLRTDLGAACETSSTCRVDFNGDLTNAAWVKVNCTIAKDLPSPFQDNRIAGCSITVTADGDATCLQTMPQFTGSTESIPHARFYLPAGVTLHDNVEITQDGTLWTPVQASMVVGRWVQIPGVVQDVQTGTFPLGCRLKNAKAGDKIGMMLANVERGYTITSSIYTPGTATVNRSAVTIQQNLANFPTIYDQRQVTIIAVCRPRMNPMSALSDDVHPVKGWTVFEMNNAYVIRGVGVGELTPYGGAHPESSLMHLDSASAALFAVGQIMLLGSGVGSGTEITALVTGTGGAGDYRTTSKFYPSGQTTPVNIDLQSRTKTAQGIALNAARKPLDPIRPGVSRIGATFTSEPYMDDFGNDPQHEDVQTNGINALGVSVDLDIRKGAVMLNGDYEITHDDQFTHAPDFNNTLVINWGGQYLGGTDSGGYVGGEWLRGIIIGRRLSDSEAANASYVLQQMYA